MRGSVLRSTACISLILLAACGSKTDPAPAASSSSAEKSKGNVLQAIDSSAPKGSAEPATDGPPSKPGEIVAKSGFSAKNDGYSFENRGSEGKEPWLTATEMRELFGDTKVCQQPMEGSDCTLTPEADEWMQKKIIDMKDGVCEGMAASSLRFFKKNEDATKISAEPGAKVELSPELKRMIGMYHVMQFTNPTKKNCEEIDAKTPNQVLDDVIKFLPGDDPLVLGFYKRTGGGHAVVPVSVESKGDGIFWLHIYDVNWPGVDRYLEFDRNKNTWKYDFAGLNAGEQADVWEGDAETHSVDYEKMSWRETRDCPFCTNSDGMREMSLNGKGHLKIKDKAGHELGVEDGKLVSTIPNAFAKQPKAYLKGHPAPEPVFYVPASTEFEVEVDGAGGADEDEDVAIFGMGTMILLDDMKLSKGEADHFSLAADGQGLHFKPSEKEKPVVKMAFDGPKADYVFELRDLDVEAGDDLELDIDPATGKLKVFDSGKTADKYDLKIDRYTGTKKEEFIKNDIALDVGEAEYIDFGAWSGDGQALTIEEDKGNDGSIDDKESEPDEPALN